MSVEVRGRVRLAGAFAIAAALTTVRADAQEGPARTGATAEAKAHFERGVAFYDETDFAAALVEFKRAYALAPAWQVLFNIGQSYFQLRNYADALGTLTRFVNEGRDQIPDGRRAVVDAERADLANRVGHANIGANRAGATISIDDVEIGVTPLGDPPLVSVGLRKVKASLPGTTPLEKEVSVPAGETVDVHFDFPELPAASAPPPPPVVIAPRLATRPIASPVAAPVNHAAAFVVYGVAVAGAAVGSVFGVLTLQDKSTLEGECAGKACGPGSQADIDAVGRDGMVSTVAFGVTAAAVVVGTVLWITAGAPARPRDSGASLPVGPVRFGPTSVGGSF